MPELPEVETMRRGVLPIVGARIVEAQRVACEKRPIAIRPRFDRLARRITERTIEAVDRVGKRVVLRTDDAQALVIEPRMTGLVLLRDPPTKEHLRLRLCLNHPQYPEVLFWDRRGLGTVTLMNADEFKRLQEIKLGPDALLITAAQLSDNLKSSRREIKPALLDQKAVAGIGNLYASEILFVAGIDPRKRCDRMSWTQWQAIHGASRFILNQAIAHEGSTLSDGTYRNALNHPGGYQNHHRVYDRQGADCPRCGHGKIARIVQVGRSTFYCPVCQRKRGVHGSVVVPGV